MSSGRYTRVVTNLETLQTPAHTVSLAGMAPIRIGFIGLSTQGWASQSLAPPLFTPLLAPHYTLTALCTRSAASATATAEKYSALAGHTVKAYYGPQGSADLARDPEVDMVSVSVKVSDHFAAVMQAIEAGKDVFVEWPPGNGYEETVKMAEAAKKKGRQGDGRRPGEPQCCCQEGLFCFL